MRLTVKDTSIRAIKVHGEDYISLTDIARIKNPTEPKDVVKNWLRSKNTIEYLSLWELLNNPTFKGDEIDPLLREAGSHSFTMSPSRWVGLTNAVGLISKTGVGGGTQLSLATQSVGLHRLVALGMRREEYRTP